MDAARTTICMYHLDIDFLQSLLTVKSLARERRRKRCVFLHNGHQQAQGEPHPPILPIAILTLFKALLRVQGRKGQA